MSEGDALIEQAKARLGWILKQKYRLDRLLGVGGMAAVYQATHRNGNQVAIKVLHLGLSLNPDARRRFLLEGYAANNLDHPGVVRVLDDDVDEQGAAFLVMELLVGRSVEDLAAAHGGTLPDRIVLDIACSLLDVLAAADEKGIVHRDIKPENLFLTSEGQLKVLDFGLARVRDAGAVRATQSGQVFGTPAFLPPEQALGKVSQVDHRSDLYATGATMFTLLSGRFVHEGETSAEHVVLAASRPARSLLEVAPRVPRPVAAIVDRALRFVKDERWQHARDMQRAIEEAYPRLYGFPPPSRHGPRASLVTPLPVSGAHAAGADSVLTIPRPRPDMRRRALWIAIPSAAVALALAAWAFGDDDPAPAPDPVLASASAPATVNVSVSPSAPVSASAPATASASASAPASSPVLSGPRPKRGGPVPGHPLDSQ